MSFQSPQRLFFNSLFLDSKQRQKQIWVVGYLNSTLKEIKNDIEEAFANGANAVVLENPDVHEMDRALKEITALYPQFKFGVNVLGPDSHLMTYAETFSMAEKYKLPIAWTDFSAVDLIHEAPETSLHQIESLKPTHTFYVSGIHMKYSTLIDPQKPIEKSAQQAMGWVDGIVITGKATGSAISPEIPHRVRQVIHDYPLGVASGVSAQNIHLISADIDFVLVNSSIADQNHRIIGSKVKELRKAFDQN